MKNSLILAVAISAFVASPALASPGGSQGKGNAYGHDKEHGNGNANGHNISGAPGPIAGAGLPVLAVGYGVYWLVKRRRREPKTD